MKREELLAEIGMLIATTCSERVTGEQAELLVARITILLARETPLIEAMQAHKQWLQGEHALLAMPDRKAN